MSAATAAPRVARPAGARWLRARRALTGEAGPGAAWALVAVSLLSVFIAVAGPRVVTAVQYSAQRSALARLPVLDLGVVAQASWLEDEAADDVLEPSAGQALAGRLAAAIRPDPVAAAGQWTSVSVPSQVILNPAPRAVINKPPTMVVTYRSGLRAYTRTVAGRLPDTTTQVPPRAGLRHGAQLLDVAVSTATASRFALHVGSRVNLGSYLPARPALLLRVTAIVMPRRPASAFWQADPNLIKPIIPLPTSGPAAVPPFLQAKALIGPDELASLQSAFGGAVIHGQWFAPLDRGRLGRTSLPGVLNHVRGLESTNGGTALMTPLPSLTQAVGTSTTMTITSGSPAAIGDFVAQQRTAAGLDALLVADVLLASLLVLVTCARLAAGAYRPELALIRARGGSARQVTGRVLARSAGLAGPGAVAGAAAGFACTPAPPSGAGKAWLLGGLAAAAAVGIPALAALWTHRGIRPAMKGEGEAGGGRADMATARPSRRRLVAELTVLVLAVAALTAARLRGGGSGSDALTWVAPVLAAAAAALIAARLYPVPVRGLLRLAAGRPGAVGFLALARAARARIGALLPALTLVISLTLAVFGVMIVGSVRAGQAAAAWQRTGADMTVQTAERDQVPAALARAVAATPGVRHVAAVYTAEARGPEGATLQSGGGAARPVGLVVVSPASYAALAGDSPWPGFPAAALARRAGGAAIPVLASAGLGAAGHATLVIGGARLPVRIAGTAGPTPAMTTGRFVLLPAWAYARMPSVGGPDLLLATGSGISPAAVRAAARHVLPHAQVRSRAQALAALRNQPAPQAAARLYWLGTGVAALLSVIALLFGLALSGRDRGRLIDRLMALGIDRGQARAVAVSEVLPLLAVAVLGTVIAGLALAEVLGPALNLAVFTGTPGLVRVRPGLIAAAPAVGIVVLGVAIVAAQSAAFLRRNLAATLRQEETG